MQRVVVLRWGHRERDKRVTTHVALTARALGASGFILSDIQDKKIKASIEKVVSQWGGSFLFSDGIPWRQSVMKWKEEGGVVVHLTVYGENIETSNVLKRIRATEKDILVIVGSRKVPKDFFSRLISDFNIAIGNQPHSECSSLAVFLDRFFKGKELLKKFEGAKIEIIPKTYGKQVSRP